MVHKIIKKIFIFPIRLYQLFISPIIGGNRACRFTPTCSNYAIEAIQKFGIIKGVFVSVCRIARCNPWGGNGYDPIDRIKNHKSKQSK
jgi:putative membrane protein insertion efficiency factor